MGTRNLTMVVKDGVTKVAQYGQWDGQPSGNGLVILNFVKKSNMDEFSKAMDRVSFCTDADLVAIDKEVADNDNSWPTNKYKHLSRDMGAGILQFLLYKDDPIQLKNSESFAKDSLFCEWAYVLDLDKQELEVYTGFNEKLTKGERFSSPGSTDGYYPVKLAKTYKLSDLPTKEQFIKDLDRDDEAEELPM